jgi:hypothetical protein
MFHLPKRLLIVFLSLFIFLFLPNFTLQQTYAGVPSDIFNTNLLQKNEMEKQARQKDIDEGLQVFSTRTNNSDLQDTMYNVTNMIICTDNDVCGTRPTALGAIASVIGTMYANPPASGLAYTRHVLQNAGLLAKPAHAQGIGFAGFSPLLDLWQATRNIAYTAIILIMVVIGFMVIFRMKIDPKTVVSIQAAIPKIVLTLVIITFSYAIVGFLVDVMYLVMGILIYVVAQANPAWVSRVGDFQQHFMSAGLFELGGKVFSVGFSTLDDFFKSGLNAIGATSVLGSIIGAVTTTVASGPIGWTGALIGFVALPTLLVFIIVLGLLLTWIKLAMILLNSYIQILLALVLGPIQLLTEAIPGKSSFGQWIMNILANLIVFPATTVLLMFAEFLATLNTGQWPTSPNSSAIWTPPMTYVPGTGTFPAFLALGMIFLMPTLVMQIKKSFAPKPIMPLTPSVLFAPLTGATQTTMGMASQFYYMQNMPVIGRFFGGGGGAHPHQTR